MKRFRLLNSKGDTIVEVLIVLAVLSLAFSIASATANQGLLRSRNAEEHSQALGVLDSQVELIRSATNTQTALTNARPFCMTGPTTFDSSFPVGYTVPANFSADDLTKYPSACVQNTYYHVSVVYDSASDNFDVRVRWDGVGTLGRQQAELTYRVHKLQAGVTDIPVTGSASQVTVQVNVIPPAAGNNTPTCSDSAIWTKDGIPVTLTQTNGGAASQTVNTTASVVVFQNVVEGGIYKATVTPPAGFVVCPPNPSGDQLLPVGSSTQISMKIYPQCYLGPNTRDNLGYYSDYLGNYVDYLGTYPDPAYAHYTGAYAHYGAAYWHHDGPDGRQGIYQGEVYYATEGGFSVMYQHFGVGTVNPWYNRFVWYGDYLGTYADYLGTYPDPAYAHYTAAYDHYSAPYTHYGPWYQPHLCPS